MHTLAIGDGANDVSMIQVFMKDTLNYVDGVGAITNTISSFTLTSTFSTPPTDSRHWGGDLRAGRDAGCDGLGLCHFQVQTYIIPGTYIMPVTLFEFSSVTF